MKEKVYLQINLKEEENLFADNFRQGTCGVLPGGGIGA